MMNKLTMPALMAALSTLWEDLPGTGREVARCSVSLPALDALLHGVSLADLHPMMPARAVRARQLSFLAGRLCAEQALNRLGCVVTSVGRNADGVPLWPEGFVGSISHSPTLAAAMAGRSNGAGGIGLDCENVATGERLESILALCCTAAERVLLQPEIYPALATLIFSAKEAGYKAIAHWLSRIPDFTEFEVCRFAPGANRLWLAPVAGNEWHGCIAPFAVDFVLGPDSVQTIVDLRACRQRWATDQIADAIGG